MLYLLRTKPRRRAALAAITGIAVLFVAAPVSVAAVTPTVPLGTAGGYSVIAAETVTNTGNSTLAASLGLWPGSSVTGFPPGQVLAPGTIEATTSAAQQAQADASTAYDNAAGRLVDVTTTADLANLQLTPGVYSGPSKSALLLSGPLVLDAQGDKSAVFVFQTDSTLITSSGSTVSLINGAQECNVFWQVGSSATLGSGSIFAGTILARASVTVNDGVTVHGRAFALTAAVTLQNDTFTQPTCDVATGPTGPTSPTDTTMPAPIDERTIPRTGPTGTALPLFAGVVVVVGGLAMFAARRRPNPMCP